MGQAPPLTVNPSALREIRTRTGLSLRELADRSGVSFSYIRQIEEGERLRPNPRIVKALAAGLDCEVAAILAAPAVST